MNRGFLDTTGPLRDADLGVFDTPAGAPVGAPREAAVPVRRSQAYSFVLRLMDRTSDPAGRIALATPAATPAGARAISAVVPALTPAGERALLAALAAGEQALVQIKRGVLFW